MSLPTFVVGSGQTLTGIIYDNIAGIRTAKDLTGATVVIKAIVNDEPVASWAAAPDANQVGNPGRYSFQMTGSSVSEEGDVLLQAWVTIGAGVPVKSVVVIVSTEESLA